MHQGPGDGLARYTDELGPILDTGAGFALLGIGLATLFEQKSQPDSPYTGWDYAGDVVSQIQLLFKFLLLTKGEEAEAVAMPLLLAVDAVVDVGAMVVQIGDVLEG